MKKDKLLLKELQVKSFTTSQAKRINGGADYDTQGIASCETLVESCGDICREPDPDPGTCICCEPY
ncbi:MAG: hypothetical protein WBB45_00645 [Cyclobacteriaceae bacterium]